MPTEAIFRRNIERRLRLMKKEELSPLKWPEGCYGSALSWLMFVGPSPGGKCPTSKRRPRNSKGGLRLWNIEFDAPYLPGETGWPGKYRANIPTLVETIIGIPLKSGSSKLYGFANFDWIPSPKESVVSPARMKRGEKDVIAVLNSCSPQVIAPLTSGSYTRLLKCLRREGYLFFRPIAQKVNIRVDPSGKSHHRSMDAVKLLGKGPLAGSVVIRIPQHPARMLFGGHGERCAKATRKAIIQVFRQRSELFVDEP